MWPVGSSAQEPPATNPDGVQASDAHRNTNAIAVGTLPPHNGYGVAVEGSGIVADEMQALVDEMRTPHAELTLIF